MNGAEILASSQTAEPTEEVATEAPKEDSFDAKFAVLAKMERKNREKESHYSSKDKEWEEKSKKLTEYEEFMKLMDENPLEAIQKRKGWGLKELNEYAVSSQSDEDLDPVAQITKKFTDQMAQMRKEILEEAEGKIKSTEEKYSQKEMEQQVQKFKYGIKDFLTENKDTYEFILAEESGMDLVYDVIQTDIINQKKRMEEDGEEGELTIMEVKDAAEKVEAYLDKQHQKYLSLNKVKSKFQSSDVDLGSLIAQSKPRTLNNSFTPKSTDVDQLSPEERKKEAERLVKSWMTRN